MPNTALCWFRRDLRLEDQAALHYALTQADEVICVFIFDTDILSSLPASDRRLSYIWQQLDQLNQTLQSHGSSLVTLHTNAVSGIVELARKFSARHVYCNRDYEPQARRRDAAVAKKLAEHGIEFHQYKDQVCFDENDILKADSSPYTVFTPYKNAWLKKQMHTGLPHYPVNPYLQKLAKLAAIALPPLSELGFVDYPADIYPDTSGWSERISRYPTERDFPALNAGSHFSVALRFGTVSIRALVQLALQHDPTWLNELIWREFFQMILFHFPHVVTQPFKQQPLIYPGTQAHFDAWCAGQTGYPIVDAGMRELQQYGTMHNRVRMITASFLVKDLLVDWRWGEAHFASLLLDYDLAANNGNWQWVASTGCDAQPYFRIFNPTTQAKKFDPEGEYVRRYVPELRNCPVRYIHTPWLADTIFDYPAPIVDHAVQREKVLALYGKVS
jgi:deoxyribodipyrimidine photo-lyase